MVTYQEKRRTLKRWQQELTQEMLDVGSYHISLYHHLEDQKPIAVLIHGFGGNYFGVTPLGYELSQVYDIIICELPAHGKSRLDTFASVKACHQFYYDLIHQLKDYGEIQLVVGHSFGCYLVSESRVSREIPTIMVNPVFDPKSSFIKASKLSQRSNITMTLCNLSLLSPIRALFLEKVYSQEAICNISKNTLLCRNSLKQLWKQRTMIFISLSKQAFSKGNSACLAIVGQKDNLSHTFDLSLFKRCFPKTEVVDLPGGHLLPLESPQETAQAILDYFD